MEYVEAFRILGVCGSSSLEDIHRAYRDKVRIYHTDVNNGSSESEEKIREINLAYDFIKRNINMMKYKSNSVKDSTDDKYIISLDAYACIMNGHSVECMGASGGKLMVLDRNNIHRCNVYFSINIDIEYSIEGTQKYSVVRLIPVRKDRTYSVTLWVPLGFDINRVDVRINIGGLKSINVGLGKNPIEMNTKMEFMSLKLKILRCDAGKDIQ